jgi:hypothetical protein
MKESEFFERIKRLKLKEEDHPNLKTEFLDMVKHDSKNGYIDLTKFQYLL